VQLQAEQTRVVLEVPISCENGHVTPYGGSADQEVRVRALEAGVRDTG
jgi:hypothetical protein